MLSLSQIARSCLSLRLYSVIISTNIQTKDKWKCENLALAYKYARVIIKESFEYSIMVHVFYIINLHFQSKIQYFNNLTLVLLNLDMSCLCTQCRSRPAGFWRSQLILDLHCLPFSIWICINNVNQVISLKIRSGHGILIYSAGQGLKSKWLLQFRHKKKQSLGTILQFVFSVFYSVLQHIKIKYQKSYRQECNK